MKEMVLLGAGASREAGIPTANEMTQVMLAKFENEIEPRYYDSKDIHSRILKFVVGGLIFQASRQGESPYEGINIEDVFNAIQLLADRKNLEAAPFISAWDPFIESIERQSISGSSLRTLQSALGKLINPENPFRSFNQRDFTNALKSLIGQNDRDNNSVVFSSVNRLMIRKLTKLTYLIDTEKIKYLIPLVQFVHNKRGTIATLNYDNAIEMACTCSEISFDTGIESWSNGGKFLLDNSKLMFLKIHGSIDWCYTSDEEKKGKPFPHAYEKLCRVPPEQNQEHIHEPAVIFGYRNKLTTRGPFLELLRSFEEALEKAERLTVIGYSFQDQHINNYLSRWLNQNERRIIRIIDPAFNTRIGTVSYENDIKQLGTFAYRLLQLYHNKNPQIEVIDKVASEGIIEAFSS